MRKRLRKTCFWVYNGSDNVLVEAYILVTLKDIARECKVSFSTVSKALKGSPEISIETTEFIQKKAQKLERVFNISILLLLLAVFKRLPSVRVMK